MIHQRMNPRRITAAMIVSLPLLVATGCGYVRSKACCPVYLPNDHLLGTEAIRVAPCGPDQQFYGLKKTTWREWPVEWQLWHPGHEPTMHAVEIIPEPQPESRPETSGELRRLEPRELSEPAKVDDADGPEEPVESSDFNSLEDMFGPANSGGASPPELPPADDEDPEPLSPSPPTSPGGADSGNEPGGIRPSSWSVLRPPRAPESRRHVPSARTRVPTIPSGRRQIHPGDSEWSSRRSNVRSPRPSKLRR